MRERLPRRLALALVVCICGIVLVCALGAFTLAARPGGEGLQLDAPQIAGHVYSIWLLPCDAQVPGQIIFGRDLRIFSSYPPPGWALPLAPPCP